MLFLLLLPVPLDADEKPSFVLIRQGEVLLFTLPASSNAQAVVGQFQNQSILFFKAFSEMPDRYSALIGVDLAQTPATYPLYVALKRKEGKEQQEYAVAVIPADFGTETLTLPKETVDLDEKTAARVEKEAEQFRNIFSKSVEERLWKNPFRVPIEGAIAGTFGQKRIINGQEKNPHTGEDIAAPLGAEVVASNHGKVVLAGDFFFNGLSIVIDHGGGLFTMYFHLSEIKVQEGAFIKQGEVIGLVGQSGRATGPHLHWGARLHNARVDPFSLIRAIPTEPSEGH